MSTPPNNTPKASAFLFDLDGVLVDTARFHFEAWRRLARELGGDFSEEQNEQLKGVSRKESLDKILDWCSIDLSNDQKEHYMKLKNEWYLELVKTLTPKDILPGAQAFLENAISKGVKTALGSASKNAPLILIQLNIDHLLHAIIDGNTVIHSKPHPEVFLNGAKALGVDPSRCVVFEDAVAGVQAAKAGGMKCVGIGEKDALEGADSVVPSLSKITVEEALNLL